VLAHLDDGPAEVPVGGPEVLSRRRTVELAFEAVGRRPCIASVPAWVPRASAPALRVAHPRLGDLVEFVTEVATHDAVAPQVGSRTLADYYRERLGAAATPGRAG